MENITQSYSESYIKCEKSEVCDETDELRTVLDCLKYNAETLKKNEALVFAHYEGARQAVTWREVYEKARTTANALIQLGVKPGDLVGINIRPCPNWLYLAFGVMFAGASPVCISFTYTDGRDLVSLMKKMPKCSLLALDPGADGENWRIIRLLLDSYAEDGTVKSKKMPKLRYLIGHEEGHSSIMKGVMQLGDLINEDVSAPDLPTVREDDIAFIVQTSGSTGLPKLVAHTHKSAVQIRHTLASGYMDPCYVLYNDRPFAWISGFPTSLIIGQKRVTVSGFTHEPVDRIAAMVDIIQRERCTALAALPPVIYSLIDYQFKNSLPEDWPLKLVITGGQSITKNVTEVIGTVAKSLTVVCGGSEFIIFCSNLYTEKKEMEDYFTGKMVSIAGYEAKVVDDSGVVLPVNTRGEVYLRAPTLFKEYHNDPEKTSSVMTVDGWYKTDDIGLMTERGDIFCFERKSCMIISGGMNVLPEILEQTLRNCSGVCNAVVVPVPDPIYHQVCCACVIKETGTDVTEQQLRDFCNEIHNDKPGIFTVLPKYYMFLDRFPETQSGKISRKELTQLATEKFLRTL